MDDNDLKDDFELDERERKVDPVQLKKELDSFLKRDSAPSDTILEDAKNTPHENYGSESSLIVEGEEIRSKFGETLIKKGLISLDQLEIALKEQRASSEKKYLGSILVELGFISDEVLYEVLREASGVDSVNLKDFKLDPDLINKIPRNIAVEHKLIALKYENDTLQVATSDVYNVIAFDIVKRSFPKSTKVIPLYANDFQISQVIDDYYQYELDIMKILKEIETGQKTYNISDDSYINPVVRLVDSIMVDAVKIGASDIHFEPESEFVRLRYRIDGELMQMISFHKQFWPSILVRMKVLSNMNIAETRIPQDGRITMTIMGRKVDFRISSLPTVNGENIVARILDIKKSLLPLTDLGLTEKNTKLMNLLLKRPEGIIIVTGPTGSGKTTTLYSLISSINKPNVNIMTMEDPVEYQIPMIRQTNIREEVNLTFEEGIRALMRQDPDIIFVGEVRDNVTAAQAVRAAMTGHLVFTTLHTNDSIGAIPRLTDLGVKGPILAGNIIASIAQRLIRRLCVHCKEEYTATKDDCIILGIDPRSPPKLKRHKGCNRCFNSGYKGRIAVYEIFIVDREVDELIAKSSTRKELLNYAKTQGFEQMIDDGVKKVLQGLTDIEELISNVDATERLRDVIL